ncbi:MAG: glucosidase [Gammaproteobacteria bacterium]|nr:MAG: glucosidase [Gammaproteobacteria bacterium]
MATTEERRLREARDRKVPWRKWGPYLSERQWGTVREDYSQTGNAWDYFSHDQARSRAYRWGEDGLAGISDDRQLLCFALALWNGRDPILKERLFGLTNGEGNHGEDVKEYYFYLDSTPSHSYMKYLFKYPQRAYPYDDLVSTNRRRNRSECEYELLDTGVFDDDCYFDVFVEYAKCTPEDVLIRLTVFNRGPEASTLHLLPSLWFRNTWSWSRIPSARPHLRAVDDRMIVAAHHELGERYFYCDRAVPWLFTENETNSERLFRVPNASPYVKDAINNYIVHGQREAVNPARTGTKAAAHYELAIAARSAQVVELRLGDRRRSSPADAFGAEFDSVFASRLREADEFYADLIPASLSEDSRRITRQAFAGMLWSKQFYNYPVRDWMEEEILPPDCQRRVPARNKDWFFLESADILSMPDKWEYPWFAAWDLAFHCMVLARVDVDFAKDQLRLMTNQVYLHPNGQIPAYEWNFSDVNPPVHCKAVWQIYMMDKSLRGTGDRAFLESMFHKLLMNFTWWVNRKDELGNNVFEGGFLGLDNIGVFDRSAPLPTGGTLEQADGTSWMAMFCLDMLTIAVELALENPIYEELACKFFEHFIYIAGAMDRIGIHNDELWDEEDGFYYDVLRLPGGESTRIKVRSMVGLIPLFACASFGSSVLERLPRFQKRVAHFTELNAQLMTQISSPSEPGVAGRVLLSPVNRHKLTRILKIMLDPAEFLSPYGIRALSRHHKEHPYTFTVGGHTHRVDYEPAESSTGLFGGNSNWRGPIWLPVNLLLIQSLRRMYPYYGDQFTVECPTGSGQHMNLWEVANEIARRVGDIFLRDAQGRRPVYGQAEKFQTDAHWRDLILFYEYFHGDNGAGIGASHQTGWTGLVAWLLISMEILDPKDIMEKGFDAIALKITPQAASTPEGLSLVTAPA